MPNTVIIEMPYLVEGQASSEITHNDALNFLDIATFMAWEDRGLSASPSHTSPADDGKSYLINGVGSGDWVGHTDAIAFFYNGWFFIDPPKEGFRARVKDENLYTRYNGSVWVDEPRVIKKASNQSVTSSTTFVVVTDFNFAVAANRSYLAKGTLFHTAGGTGDLKLQWTFPASCTVTAGAFNESNGLAIIADTSSPIGDFVFAGNTLDRNGNFSLVIDVGGTAGTVELEFAQVAVDATPTTIYARSHLEVIDITND